MRLESQDVSILAIIYQTSRVARILVSYERAFEEETELTNISRKKLGKSRQMPEQLIPLQKGSFLKYTYAIPKHIFLKFKWTQNRICLEERNLYKKKWHL